MLAWLISALLAHQEVLERFRAIVETFMTLDKASSFDSASFCADPFIQAVWKEALRLGVSSSAARVVTRQTEIEGYIVKPGSVILIPTRVLHFDENVFTQPDQFNPWRWINEQTEKDGNPLPAVSADQLKKQNDSFRPFGGGTGVCSGRFIAEREVLMAAAVLLHRFDFLVQPGQQIAQPNLNPRALGAMYPLVDPNVTVRSRR
ncbi:uncharacterized protein PFLUO_LOCUS3233 [Penicillium psychrofluorescens]|uniref:uncharacterized protein n=1 Tax=Penicillium psychrofluorescens TaxID=3158075 RepID=UPI003CCCDDC4